MFGFGQGHGDACVGGQQYPCHVVVRYGDVSIRKGQPQCPGVKYHLVPRCIQVGSIHFFAGSTIATQLP